VRVKRVLLWLQFAGLMVGAVAFGKPAQRWIKRSVAEARAESTWREWRADPLNSERPPGSGEPAFWLRVPSVDLDSLVLFGANEENLQRFPCVHVGAAGQEEVTVIMAHRDYHFSSLEALEIGGELELENAASESARYRICDIEIVATDDLAEAIARRRGRGASLALLTCYPFGWAGPAPQRVLFWAQPLPTRSPDRAVAER
jgi:sortase A